MSNFIETKGGDALPSAVVCALDDYIARHVRPSSFLQMVIRNDLLGAVMAGTPDEIQMLPLCVEYMYDNAPALSYGSPVLVRRWYAQAEGVAS